MNRHNVSINILNYNTFEKSRVCIESCLKQKGVDYRILLVDNKSTDDSFLRLQSLYGDKIHYLQTGHNYGFAKGNNICVQDSFKSGYELSFLLNSDTELCGSYLLQELVECLVNHERCSVVAPLIYDVTKSGLIPHTNDSFYLKALRAIRVLPKNKKYSNFAELSEAHGSALLVCNEDFIKVGGFPEHYFMYGEESTFAKKTLWSQKNILGILDSSNYVLHHHDKSKKTDAWRLYLMARNRGLEYLENRSLKPISWTIVMVLFLITQFCRSIGSKEWIYFKGMKDAWILSRRKDKEYCFKSALDMKEKLLAK